MWQLLKANASYMLSGKLRSKNGYAPQRGHDVPQDFCGVGVATAANPAVDDYLIAQLKALNVLQVRLDFSYGDDINHNARFLQALHASGFKVMLHLVQPLVAAKLMHTEAAQHEWQVFVSNTLQRFISHIDIIEIGSTINRRRWAGYTLEGFLTTWQIAHDEVRRYPIKLAGPNITDFEPPYNIGLLAILQSRGQLPDIHTDNLFSERCTEPERDDHKVLGHRLAPLGGFRLVKKAFVLQEIGAHFGVPELQSPAAFWTLPRIHRLFPQGEQKQADYLARYMLLCAASGALQRANWGPLACHREGLIDDGVTTYPELERITHYAGVGSDLGQYRLRPAFAAMSTFNRLIPGMHYEGQLNQDDHLEVHAFSSPQHRIHALWTINGKAAAIADIYQSAQLAQAECITRDGVVLSGVPDLVTESPVYLRFAREMNTGIKAEAEVLPSLAIHAHAENACYKRYDQDGWQGLILGNSQHEADLLHGALNPVFIGKPPKEALLRNARNAVWRIQDPRDSSRQLVVKQPVKMHLHKKWLDRFKPSKAKRSWNGTNELLRRGIDAAKPVAYFELIDDDTLMQNYYICEYIAADFSARDLFIAFSHGEQSYQGVSQQQAYRQLCDYLLTMHGHGAFFRDLSGGNILIRKGENEKLHFSLIDTNRAHFFNQGTSLGKRLSDLTRICNKLHAQGRDEFMTMYMQALGKQFSWQHKLPFYIYNAKVDFKRKFGRKAIKRLFKRNK